MGSQAAHDELVKKAYEQVKKSEECAEELDLLYKEAEYGDNKRAVGECDILGISVGETYIYGEIKSSYKQISKGYKQENRFEDYFNEIREVYTKTFGPEEIENGELKDFFEEVVNNV